MVFESLLTSQTLSVSPYATLAGILSSRTLPYEAVQSLTVSYNQAWESLIATLITHSPHYEVLKGASSFHQELYEALGYLARNNIIPWEAVSAIITNTDALNAFSGIVIFNDTFKRIVTFGDDFELITIFRRSEKP
jgi:hypothetical protein